MVNLLHAFAVKPDQHGQLPPKETVNIRIILLALTGSCAAILFGYDLGFIGGVITLPAFISDFDEVGKTADQKTAFSSNVVSVFQAGAIFGAITNSFISDKWGRRKTLMGNVAFYMVGAALMTAAKGKAGIPMMYTGRIITGWGVGASTMLVPIYVAECSPPHVRGRLVGLYEVGVQFGTMIGFWIAYALLETVTGSLQWRVPMAFQLVPSGLVLIALIFLTETPRFMVKQHGEEKALATLAWLRNLPADHPYVIHELVGISAQVEHERLMSNGAHGFAIVRESFHKSNLRRLITGCLIMIFFQLAGTNAVNYFSPEIFRSLGLSASSAKLFATGIYGVVRFVSTLIAMVAFSDRFGRVQMIVIGGSIMALCMWIVGALAATHPPVTGQSIQPAEYAAITFIFVWAVAFCFSYAGIPWIFCSEIFPLRIRSFCMAVCTATHWAFNLMLAKSTPYMLENITYGIYFVFAGCTTLGAILEYFYMPETRGRSLEEMDHLFSGWQPTKRIGSPRLGSSAIQKRLEVEGSSSAGASTPGYDMNEVKGEDLHVETV